MTTLENPVPDLKDVFSSVLDGPAPPPATREQMLTHARSAARRRRTGTVAAGAVAVIAVAAGAVAAPRLVAGGAADAQDRAGIAAAGPSVKVTHETAVRQLMVTLRGLVPQRFTLPSGEVVTGPDGHRYVPQLAQVVSLNPPAGSLVAGTDVYWGAESGSTTVSVDLSGKPAPTGDLCKTGAILHQGVEAGCMLVSTSGDDWIRLAWRALGDNPAERITYATRFYPGGSVTVQMSPLGLKPDTKTLSSPIWTDAQLAGIAASPALWPAGLPPFDKRTREIVAADGTVRNQVPPAGNRK